MFIETSMVRVILVLCLTSVSNCYLTRRQHVFQKCTSSQDNETCGYENCPMVEPGVLNVHLVPHTHDDVGWLKTVDQYYYGSKNYIQKAGVQYILDSVIKALQVDSTRRKLNDTFGTCGVPHVGWQVDTFGHSREFASLLAAMGYDGLLLARIHYQDKIVRLKENHMEMVWRGDDDLGKSSDIYTGILFNKYFPPKGFCFDILCTDEPIVDDPQSPEYNVETKVMIFVKYLQRLLEFCKNSNVLVPMGGDFTYQDADMWYKNIDKLIKYTNMKSPIFGLKLKLYYSTPNCYLKAVKDAKLRLATKQDDFFPFASDPASYWTGFYTSRPTLKYFERETNTILQVVKQLQVLKGQECNLYLLDELRSAMGIMQHHDAITGTAQQHVVNDYTRLLDKAVNSALLIARQALNKFVQSSVDTDNPPTIEFKRCYFNESQCNVSENSNQFIVTIYNPLAWRIEAVPIRIPVPNKKYTVFSPTGEQMISQLVKIPEQVLKIPKRKSNATHEIVFIACNVPAMGFKSFYIKAVKSTDNLKIETCPRAKKTKKNEKRHIHNFKNRNYDWKNTYDDIRNIENILRTPVKQNDKINPVLDNILQNSDLNTNRNEENLIFDKDYDSQEDTLNNTNDEFKLRDLEKQGIIFGGGNKNAGVTPKRILNSNHLTKTKYLNVDDDEPMKLGINHTTKQLTHVITGDGTKTKFCIRMFYYPGFFGDNVKFSNRSSGAYIFRPNGTKPCKISGNHTKVIKGFVVKEIQYTLSNYASGVVRAYKHAKLNYIENEWLVGPIPVKDNIGKEILVRYDTDVINQGTFYTDSNGRQMLKRKLNQRPQWNFLIDEPIAGNYYPVTNKIFIENNKRITVLTDRAQGGSSLTEGNIELMLHRRLLHDDGFGVDEALNETIDSNGLVVRGKHKIFISKCNDKSSSRHEKKKTLENSLQPVIFVSEANNLDLQKWMRLKNKYSAMKNNVPDGIHILTLEPLNNRTLLLRIENYLEKIESEKNEIEVDISNLFNDLKLISFRETTLSANQWVSDVKKWNWKKENKFAQSFNQAFGSFDAVEEAKENKDCKKDVGLKVILRAKQIRTFVVTYKLVDTTR